jgi:hypothetical protein
MRHYSILLAIATLGSLLLGCGEHRGNPVDNALRTYSATNAPELEKYVLEFSEPRKTAGATEPSKPFPSSIIEGHIDSLDHNTNYGLWVARTHTGSNFYDGQRIYLYSDHEHSLREVVALRDRRIEDPVIPVRQHTGDISILAAVWPMHSQWWKSELWTNSIRTGAFSVMAAGGGCTVSPDHTKVAFWRTDGSGFHSLHLWDANTGTIQDIISMWEVDPGSGTSWHLKWSADSNALGLKGACGGFSRHRDRGRKDLNLIYLVPDKQMFQIPATAAPPNA